jgi:hypothetical protein
MKKPQPLKKPRKIPAKLLPVVAAIATDKNVKPAPTFEQMISAHFATRLQEKINSL